MAPILTIHSDAATLEGWRYFWLKRVTGFNPVCHCARCLVGSYLTEVNDRMAVNHAVTLPLVHGEIGYLCGVSAHYRWGNNLHVAFIVAPGESIEAETYDGDTIVLTDAQRIEFDGREAARRFPHLGRDFLTCRNFQFGAHHFRE